MPTYTTKGTHPGTSPSASIYIMGLLCLAFNDTTKKCTVAVNPVAGHEWKFQVRKRGSSTDILVRDQIKNPTDKEIRIEVTGGTTGIGGTNAAQVYNGSGASASGEARYNLETSWVDLEGPRGHGERVAHDADTLSPRIYIDDGLFCAYRLSTGLFKLKDHQATPCEKHLNHVALAVVADIYLKSSGSIKIIHPDDTLFLEDKDYQIYITNNCECPCDVSSIDFADHYNAFTGAFDPVTGTIDPLKKFDLVYEEDSDPGNCDSIFPEPGQEGGGGGGAGLWRPGLLTDRAPCMSVTLGQTAIIN